MNSRLAFAPNARAEIKTEQTSRFLFTCYIGAVYFRYGMSPIKSWLDRLINSDGSPTDPGPLEPAQPTPALFQSSQPPLRTNSPQSNVLSKFNQILSQKHLTVVWHCEGSGPAHERLWTVECLVDGEQKGRGSGRNVKLAKENAAKDASVAMGLQMSV